MVKAVALFFSLSLIFKFASVAAYGGSASGDENNVDNGCPAGYQLKHVAGWQWNGCQCINDQYHSKPFRQGWSATAIRNAKGGWECKPRCDQPEPPKPSPSSKPPGHGYGGGKPGQSHGNHGHGNNGHGHGKRWVKRLERSALRLCPEATLECPIAGFGPADVECVHSKEDIDNCGACGNSCSRIVGAKSTACISGKCEISSCAPGYKLDALALGGVTCEVAS